MGQQGTLSLLAHISQCGLGQAAVPSTSGGLFLCCYMSTRRQLEDLPALTPTFGTKLVEIVLLFSTLPTDLVEEERDADSTLAPKMSLQW